MHKVILFRGGYCGDVILSMINKEYVRSYLGDNYMNSRDILDRIEDIVFTEKATSFF